MEETKLNKEETVENNLEINLAFYCCRSYAKSAGLMPNLLEEFSSQWMNQQDMVKDCSTKMYYVDYNEKVNSDSSSEDQ
jgi:hypothetical protein